MTIADTLRKSVLQAAIQGKLTAQLPEDGNAADLLAEIKAEKAKLIKEGKLKKEKPFPEITEDEIPFEIPENWVWCRLGDITDYGIGKQVDKKNIAQVSWILELEDIEKGKLQLIDKRKDRIPGSSKNRFYSEDILYGKLRPYLKKAVIADEDGFCTTEIIPFRGYGNILSKYLLYFMVSPWTDHTINSLTYGMDMPRLGTKDAVNLIVPLPPLSEQKRIVEKIEEILPKIEKLEKNETQLKSIQTVFPAKMKNSILQHAIQGKLTEQLPSDGDANELLTQIKAEKAKLIKEGKLKKEKPLPPISADEIPFEIPENWVWCRFKDLVNYSMGKTPPRGEIELWGKDFPWISISDMVEGALISSTKERISDKGFQKTFKRNFSPKGTLIMSFKLTIGRVSVLNIDAVHNEAIISIFPYLGKTQIDNYFKKILPVTTQWGKSKDAIKGKTLNSKSLDLMLIPLPPLSEQERIVEKLEELLPLCEGLG